MSATMPVTAGGLNQAMGGVLFDTQALDAILNDLDWQRIDGNVELEVQYATCTELLMAFSLAVTLAPSENFDAALDELEFPGEYGNVQEIRRQIFLELSKISVVMDEYQDLLSERLGKIAARIDPHQELLQVS